VAHIATNRDSFGLAQALVVHHGTAPAALAGLPVPQAVFVGGGFDHILFEQLRALAPAGCRLVVNAVTLETQAALVALQPVHGGELLKLELAHAAPLGRMRGWAPSRPLVQWRTRW